MISDSSPDFEGTWSFLDRRMSDIGMVISAKETVSLILSTVGRLLVDCRPTHWPMCWPTRWWDRILNFYPCFVDELKLLMGCLIPFFLRLRRLDQMPPSCFQQLSLL